MKYFSCFSGIGGFELGITQAYANNTTHTMSKRDEKDISSGLNFSDTEHSTVMTENPTCVGFSEIDKYATQIYQSHFPTHQPYGDITKIDTATLPDFDCLVGGFPCQAFSIAGKRRGFEDTRGTLFFELARILRAKQPRLFVFENVKGLLSHDNGKTFSTIIATIDELGYDCQWQVLNSKNHGVPQNRERVFIVGNRKDTGRPNVFPIMSRYGTNEYEKVYSLSETVSLYGRELLLGMAQQEKKEVSREQMQKLLKETLSGIRKGECGEAENTQENLGGQPEVNIQEIDTFGAFLESADDSGTIHGMVSIPTEDMLILWNNSGKSQENTGLIQQQNSQDDDGQDGLIQRLRTIEHYPLLLAVQPYQGKLFYSLGDGRNWQNIYISKIQKVGPTNLSSILEAQPDQKYFLSEKAVDYLLRASDRGRLRVEFPLRGPQTSNEECIIMEAKRTFNNVQDETIDEDNMK